MASEQENGKSGGSQTLKAQLELRNLILSGALSPGERLSELTMVERLGVSRTPVRAALQKLSEEGLLEPIVSGGYAVKGFSERDVYDSIELRGALEGLAARFAAERGVGLMSLSEIKDCLDRLDDVVGRENFTSDDFEEYVKLNERFHTLLIGLADSRTLAREIERIVRMPFASPNGFVMAQTEIPEAHMIRVLAQDHHRSVVEAIERREGARAEALMREHARLAHRNLRFALRNQQAIAMIRGGSLIQRHT